MGFAAVAAAHREPELNRKLLALLDSPPLEPPAGAWLRQAVSTGRALRLSDISAASLADAGLPFDERIGDVAVVPMTDADAVIVAVRGHATGRYGLHERRALQTIAASPAGVDTSGHTPDSGTPLLEGVAAAIALTDSSGVLTYVNQAFCELVGAAADRLVGLEMDELVELGSSARRSGFAGTEATDQVLRRPDGGTGWVSVTSQPLFDRGGRWHASVHTMVDVTDRKQGEIEMRTRLDCERVLAEFAELVLSHTEPGSAAPRAVDLLTEQFGAPLAVLLDVARDRSEVKTLAAAGELAEREPGRWRGRHALPARSATMAALQTGETVTVSDFEADGYVPGPIARAAGASSAVCAPIADGAACLAVIRQEVAGIDDQERMALEGVAGLLSSRWTNVRV